MPADTDQPTLAVTSQGQADARAYLLARCVATDQRSITVSKSLLEIACADTRTHSEPRPVAGLDGRCGFNGGSVLDAPKSAEWMAACELLAQQFDRWNMNDRAKQVRAGHPAWLIEHACVEAIVAATLSPDPTSLEGGEGVERIVSRAIHEHLSRRDIMQYLDNEGDCQGLARSVLAALATHSPAPMAGEGERQLLERAIDRMGWDEIHAFQAELRKGQDIYEDAGGYFLRAIRALFGIKQTDTITTYQDAARALVAAAHPSTAGGGER